jgi:hypothetical protein
MMSAGYDGPSGATIRVSDAEREATAAELREHYAAGRLTTDELNERLDQALAAKTRGELTALMGDLPHLRSRTAPLTGPGQPSAGASWNGPSGYPTGHHGWGGEGGNDAPGWGPGRIAGPAFSLIVAICLLSSFGIMAIFGLGGGSRPFGLALLLAALALLRRLIFRGRRPRRGRAGRGRTRRRS